jgi:thiosulfate dehydrogenase (quinone) large subunit
MAIANPGGWTAGRDDGPETDASACEPSQIPEPPIARFLFADARMAWLWLIVRVYCGYEWLEAGLSKVGSPAWTGPQAGAAIAGFVNGALAKTGGEHPDVTGWYAAFLQDVVLPNAGLRARLVAYGEVLVGVALVVGGLTGVAAFFGTLMNANYLLAGTVSSNPILSVLGTWLVLAWRVAGWWGLDRWLLPLLGTPWRPGPLLHRADAPAAAGRARRSNA